MVFVPDFLAVHGQRSRCCPSDNEEPHVLGPSSVPSTVLEVWQMLFHSIMIATPSSPSRWELWGSVRLTHQPKVMEKPWGRLGQEPELVRSQCPRYFSNATLPTSKVLAVHLVGAQPTSTFWFESEGLKIVGKNDRSSFFKGELWTSLNSNSLAWAYHPTFWEDTDVS